MITKLVAFRIPTDRYEAFQEGCSDENTTVSEKLRHFIYDYLSMSSQSQAASPGETNESEESNTDQEERITQLEETMTAILERLDNIQGAFPLAAGAGIEDGSEPVPGEISIEEEHISRVQPGPGEPKEKKEEPDKEEHPWPFNLFLK